MSRIFCSLLLLISLCACKTERTVGEKRQELDPIRKKFAGNYNLERDETGMVKVQSERRSEFEAHVFRGTDKANADKEFKTSAFKGSKEFKTDAFQGNKEFKTKLARDQNQESRWQWPWKNRQNTPRDADKIFDTGDTFPTEALRDGGRVYPTRSAPEVVRRRSYADDSVGNIRPAGDGDGPGPSIRDVRDMLGKDE